MRSFRATLASVAGLCFLVGGDAIAVQADESPRAELMRLGDLIRQYPEDYASTYRYVLLSVELRDEEAAA
jgi:hypothetical protein